MIKRFGKLITLMIIFQGLTSNLYSQEDFTKYIDPTIGNVSRFLVPTFPTMHLPNQMLRMVPVKADYISDQVTAFPLQIPAHRNRPGLFLMKVTLGDIVDNSWKQK